MVDYGYQVQVTGNTSEIANNGVIVWNEVPVIVLSENISHDNKGIITIGIAGTGIYIINWWAAIQSSNGELGSVLELNVTQGEIIDKYYGYDPSKNGEVYGMALINVTRETTLTLKNVSGANIAYGKYHNEKYMQASLAIAQVNLGGIGYSGYTGYIGIKGYTGYTGYTLECLGDTGYMGYSGYTGYMGETGYTGYTGSTGRTGPNTSDSNAAFYAYSITTQSSIGVGSRINLTTNPIINTTHFDFTSGVLSIKTTGKYLVIWSVFVGTSLIALGDSIVVTFEKTNATTAIIGYSGFRAVLLDQIFVPISGSAVFDVSTTTGEYGLINRSKAALLGLDLTINLGKADGTDLNDFAATMCVVKLL